MSIWEFDRLTGHDDKEMAEPEGFEPSIGCPIHAFQACAIDHSATAPQCYSESYLVEILTAPPPLVCESLFRKSLLGVRVGA